MNTRNSLSETIFKNIHCPFCNMDNNDLIKGRTCKHYVHKKCLNEWYKIHNNCPSCGGLLERRAIESCIKIMDINEADDQGETILMKIAAGGDWILVNGLLEFGADPFITDNRGNSAFDYALRNGHKDVSRLMMDKITYLRSNQEASH